MCGARGSLEIGDMLSNLSAQPMEAVLLGRAGRVHEGMMSAATYVHCNTGAALADAARRFPGWPLLVTGHSMGAASNLDRVSVAWAPGWPMPRAPSPAGRCWSPGTPWVWP